MTTNPYAPPVSSAEPVPVKRPLFKSGVRLLLFGFLTPILAYLSRGLILLATLPENGMVRIIKPGTPPAARSWDLDNVAAAGVEIIGVLGGAGVLFGVIMLSREPLNMAKKVSPWVRGGAMIVSSAGALLSLSKCICWFFQNNSYRSLFMLEITSRWVAVLVSLWLIRAISVVRRNSYIRQLATASIVMSVVVQGMGAMVAGGNSAAQFVVTIFGVPQALLCFGTIWSARKLETPSADLSRPKKRAKPKRREPIVSPDKAA